MRWRMWGLGGGWGVWVMVDFGDGGRRIRRRAEGTSFRQVLGVAGNAGSSMRDSLNHRMLIYKHHGCPKCHRKERAELEIDRLNVMLIGKQIRHYFVG